MRADLVVADDEVDGRDEGLAKVRELLEDWTIEVHTDDGKDEDEHEEDDHKREQVGEGARDRIGEHRHLVVEARVL